MSGGYAARLKKGVDYGTCGLPEIFDSPRILTYKINRLVSLIRTSKYIVVFTGAGISTACGISDFRGPKGIWTKEQEEEKKQEKLDKEISKKAKLAESSPPSKKHKKEKNEEKIEIETPKEEKTDFRFEDAHPSLTHMALLGLLESNKIKFICTQNVDNIHYRSGVKREYLAELHGNVMVEKCEKCQVEYVRNFDVKGIGFSYTGRVCENEKCGGKLRDVLLDWDSPLPDRDYKLARKHFSKADLVICLGTSLRVQPANKLPELVLKNNGKIVICNLQKTPKDSKSEVLIHTKCDNLMRELMRRLDIPIPVYRRVDNIQISVIIIENGNHLKKFQLTTIYPNGIPCAFIKEIEVHYEGTKLASSSKENPCTVEWSLDIGEKLSIELEIVIHFTNHFNKKFGILKQILDTQKKTNIQLHSIETTLLDYNTPTTKSNEGKEEEKTENGNGNEKTLKRKREDDEN